MSDTGGETSKKKSKAPATRSATAAVGGSSNSVMEHIINICGFPEGSTMVEIFQQEGWVDIADITMITMSEADGLHTTNSDGGFKAKPMTFHLRRFKAFLMYYNRKCANYQPRLMMRMS